MNYVVRLIKMLLEIADGRRGEYQSHICTSIRPPTARICAADAFVSRGQDALNHLYRMLEKKNRTEDILRAINDPEYLKQLMEEFGNPCEKGAIKPTGGQE